MLLADLWFDDNLRKSDPDKFHLLVSTNDHVAIRIENFQTENNKRENLLRYKVQQQPVFWLPFIKYAKELSENFMI